MQSTSSKKTIFWRNFLTLGVEIKDNKLNHFEILEINTFKHSGLLLNDQLDLNK